MELLPGGPGAAPGQVPPRVDIDLRRAGLPKTALAAAVLLVFTGLIVYKLVTGLVSGELHGIALVMCWVGSILLTVLSVLVLLALPLLLRSHGVVLDPQGVTWRRGTRYLSTVRWQELARVEVSYSQSHAPAQLYKMKQSIYLELHPADHARFAADHPDYRRFQNTLLALAQESDGPFPYRLPIPTMAVANQLGHAVRAYAPRLWQGVRRREWLEGAVEPRRH